MNMLLKAALGLVSIYAESYLWFGSASDDCSTSPTRGASRRQASG